MCLSGIEIKQNFENAALCGPIILNCNLSFNENIFNIHIEQAVIRTISITSEKPQDINVFLDFFDCFEKLLMIGDGRFIPISTIKGIYCNNYIDSPELNSIFSQRVDCYKSSDFVIGNYNKFLDFNLYINENTFDKWKTLLSELDITHTMFLYCESSIKLTSDIRCAFIIESMNVLYELVKSHIDDFSITHDKYLKDRIKRLIEKYGNDIFDKEFQINTDNFLQSLVNSRNRIAHIKSNQNKYFLSGPESILYSVKLSFLYRIVIFELLGIEYEIYKEKVLYAVELWNNWESVFNNYTDKLNNVEFFPTNA